MEGAILSVSPTPALSLVSPDTPPSSGPSPATPPAKQRELLSAIVAVLDEVIPEFGDLDEWKWACIGIREDVAEVIQSLDQIGVAPALSPAVPPLAVAPVLRL